MISHKHKFIFFHIPKAAGTSVIGAFRNAIKEDVVLNDRNRDLMLFLKEHWNIKFPNHLHASKLKLYMNEKNFEEYFKFSFVRNPWDKLVSIYFYTKQKESHIVKKNPSVLTAFNRNILSSPDFESWIKSRQFGELQSDYLYDADGELLVDFIGKTEQVEEDFKKILQRLKLTHIQMELKNPSNHKDYQDYYSAESQEIVHEHYLTDIENFNYSFD